MKKKFLKDSIINTVAVSLPVLFLQFIILPFLGRIMNSEVYGFTVTIIGLLNFIATRSGNTLNNVRLINSKNANNDKDVQQDFLILLFVFCLFTSVIIVAITMVCCETKFSIFLLFFTAVCMFLREYLIVYFRISLSYISILISYTIQTIGLLIGVLLFWISSEWLWIYFLGNFLPILYIYSVNKIDIKISFQKSDKFWQYFVEELHLLSSSLLNGFSIYADKLFILPLLGATAVSIFYVSSVCGRMMDMVIGPVSSVALSYLSKGDVSRKSVLRKVLIPLLLLAVLFYFICISLAPILVKILYPQYINKIDAYLNIMIGVGILNCVYIVLNVFVIRYVGTKTQMMISVVGVIIFIIISLYLSNIIGLMGFCISSAISNVTKIIVSLVYLFKQKI